ncbi:hypothetical protein QP994_01225 [Corynebacterium sp. MSK044]|nr:MULTISPECIES: hypothetical protein [unclassified Corynebacterium]MDK8794126.1 hypothetical protein [Corynebacterium sp. MSK041]MDK8796507.1 hypothetical protein [Corynebacterium sp. MSK044]
MIMPMDAFPHEQIQLSTAELEVFQGLTEIFEVRQEHVLDPALMLYITR